MAEKKVVISLVPRDANDRKSIIRNLKEVFEENPLEIEVGQIPEKNEGAIEVEKEVLTIEVSDEVGHALEQNNERNTIKHDMLNCNYGHPFSRLTTFVKTMAKEGIKTVVTTSIGEAIKGLFS